MQTLREWVIDSYDGYGGLRLQACQIEEPGPTEVRLRVEAFALNWGDEDLMRNAYSFSFSSFPARVGIEAAGIVEAVGAAVTDVKVGARYCALPYFYDKRGASADTMLIDQAYITPAPDNLSAVESASVWMQFMTAYFPMIELAKAGAGRNLFIPAGTSTAGNAAIQVAKQAGATVITSTRQARNEPWLKSDGADHVFVDQGQDLEAYLREVTDGDGIHASFDPVGGGFMDRYANAMSKGGILMLYGGLSGSYDSPPFLPMIQNSLWFHTYSLFNYVEDTAACQRGTDFVHAAISAGRLKPKVDRVFPMEGFRDAWAYVKSARNNYGKVVIETGV